MSVGELFTGLAYVVGGAVFYWAARRRRPATDGVALTVGVGLVSGIIGAKITQLLAEGWPLKIPFLVALNPNNGGRALLGGVVFGWLGVVLAKRSLGIRRSTGDMFALASPAGEAVGRIGCYFNGCCYGAPSRVPWAVFQHGEWRRPSPIYSAFTSVGLFVWLLCEAKKKGIFGLGDRVDRETEGELFFLYLIGFGMTRFLIEFVRGRENVLAGLSPMQWFCLDLLVVGAIGLRKPSHKTRSPLPPEAA